MSFVLGTHSCEVNHNPTGKFTNSANGSWNSFECFTQFIYFVYLLRSHGYLTYIRWRSALRRKKGTTGGATCKNTSYALLSHYWLTYSHHSVTRYKDE